MQRRAVLKRTAVVGTLSAAGCLRLADDESQSPEDSGVETPAGDRPPAGDTPAPCESTEIPAAAGADWPTFQRDAAHTGYAPDETVPEDGVCPAWRVEVDGRIRQLLCIGDTLIYPGNNDTGPLRALDRRTGEVRWDAADTVHDEFSGNWATPAADESRLYAAGYVDGTRHLFALDIETGAEIWRHTPDGERRFGLPVTLSDGRLYGYQRDHDGFPDELVCLDASSGRQIWTQADVWGTLYRSPTVHDGTVYVAIDGTETDPKAGGVEAFDAQTGTHVWRGDLGRVEAAPAVVDDTVFIARPDGPDSFYALDATDGSERWVYETLNGTKGSPAVAGDVAVFGDSDGVLHGVDVGSGTVRWTYDATARLSQAAPIIVDETVICSATDTGGEPGLRAVSLHDGTETWQFLTEYSVYAPPIVSAGTIYFSTDVGTIFALR